MEPGMMNRFIDHLQVVTTNNYYTISDFHSINHSTLSLFNLHSRVFTALHNGYASAVASLYVLWEWILTSVVRWLILRIPQLLNCTAVTRSPFSIWFDSVLYYLHSPWADLEKTSPASHHHAHVNYGHSVATAVHVTYRDASSFVACGHHLAMDSIHRVST
jgi:hypothetical protein